MLGSCVSGVLAGQSGTFGRNQVRGLGAWQLDFASHRDFPLTERLKLQFRAEGFNLLNRVRWGGPDSTFTSPTFGIVRSQANNPRQMQFALKFNF